MNTTLALFLLNLGILTPQSTRQAALQCADTTTAELAVLAERAFSHSGPVQSAHKFTQAFLNPQLPTHRGMTHTGYGKSSQPFPCCFDGGAELTTPLQ